MREGTADFAVICKTDERMLAMLRTALKMEPPKAGDWDAPTR